MKTILTIFIFIIFTISCNHKDMIFDSRLKTVLDDYIHDYPLMITKNYKEMGMSYPSYHIYFEVENKDTILNIFLSPVYDNLLNKQIINSDETIFNSVKTDGFILYKERYPIVFFNSNFYNIQFSKHFIKEIPDSLKYRGGPIVHNKSKIYRYKIKSNSLERIEK